MRDGLKEERAGHMWGAVAFWGSQNKWGWRVGSEARSGHGVLQASGTVPARMTCRVCQQGRSIGAGLGLEDRS